MIREGWCLELVPPCGYDYLVTIIVIWIACTLSLHGDGKLDFQLISHKIGQSVRCVSWAQFRMENIVTWSSWHFSQIPKVEVSCWESNEFDALFLWKRVFDESLRAHGSSVVSSKNRCIIKWMFRPPPPPFVLCVNAFVFVGSWKSPLNSHRCKRCYFSLSSVSTFICTNWIHISDSATTLLDATKTMKPMPTHQNRHTKR